MIFAPFLTPLPPLYRCFISDPLLIKSDLAEPPLPSDVIYGRPLSFNISDLDLPQNFDTCITIISDYTAPKAMLDRGHKKSTGKDISNAIKFFWGPSTYDVTIPEGGRGIQNSDA